MRRGHLASSESDWDEPAGPVRSGRRGAPRGVEARAIVDRLAWTDWPRVLWAGTDDGDPPQPPSETQWDAALERADQAIARRLRHQPAGVYAVRLAAATAGGATGATGVTGTATSEGESRLAELLRRSNRPAAEGLPLREVLATGSHNLSDSRRFPKALPKLVGDAEDWRRKKESDLRDARAALDAADAWAQCHAPQGHRAAPTGSPVALSPDSLLLESLCLWVGSGEQRPSRRLEPSAVAAELRATQTAGRERGQPDRWREAAWAFLGQKRLPQRPQGPADGDFAWYRCGKLLPAWPLDVLLHVARTVGGPDALASRVASAPELTTAPAATVLRELLLARGVTEIREAIQTLPALLKLFKGQADMVIAAGRAGAFAPHALAGVEQWVRGCSTAHSIGGAAGTLPLALAGLMEVHATAEQAGLSAEQCAAALETMGRYAPWLLRGELTTSHAGPFGPGSPPAPSFAPRSAPSRSGDASVLALAPASRSRIKFLGAATAAGLDARQIDWVLESGLTDCVEAVLSVQPKRAGDLLGWLRQLVTRETAGAADPSAARQALLSRWGLTGRSSRVWGYAFGLLNPATVTRYFEWARRLPVTAPQLSRRWEPMELMRWLFDLALPPRYARAAPALFAAPAAAPGPGPSPAAGPKAAFLSRHADRLLAGAEALLRRPPSAAEADPADAARQRLAHWQRCAEIAGEWAGLKLPDAPAAFDRLLSAYPPKVRRPLFDLYGGEPLRTLLRVCDGRPERAAVLGATPLDLSWEEAEQIARAWDCVAPIDAARTFFGTMAGRPKCAARALRLLTRIGFCLRLQGERRLREKLEGIFASGDDESGGTPDGDGDPAQVESGQVESGRVEPGRVGPDGPEVRSSPAPSPEPTLPPQYIQPLRRLLRLRPDGRLPARVDEILRRPGQLQAELRALEAREALSLSAGSRADKLRRLLGDPAGLRDGIDADLRVALPEALDEACFKAMEQLVRDVTAGHVRKIIGTTPPQPGSAHGLVRPSPPGAPDPEDDSRNWDNAVRLYFSVRKNRKALKRLMRHEAHGDREWLRDFPPNRAFLDRVAARDIDAAAWLAPFARTVPTPAGPWRIEVETNPLHVLRMGNYFGTCLSEGREYAYATIANAVEANKRVVYVRDERGDVIGRKLLVMTRDGHVLGFRSYGMGPLDPWGESPAGPSPWMKIRLDAFCREWADACRARLHPFPAPSPDGGDPYSEDDLTLFAHWYNDSPEPFDPAWLAHSPEALRHFAAEAGPDFHPLLGSLCDASDDDAAPALRAVLWLGDDALGLLSSLLRKAEADVEGRAGPVFSRATAVAHFIARHALPGELRRAAESWLTAHPEPGR